MAAKAMTFEQAMKRLEEIVTRLESGDESLEGSLKLFEEGTALSSQCYKKLEKAEQKIRTLAGEKEDAE